MKQLGKIEKVNPREIWSDESKHFTPWLRDNTQALSEAKVFRQRIKDLPLKEV